VGGKGREMMMDQKNERLGRNMGDRREMIKAWMG
jgi:hypothetical protein